MYLETLRLRNYQAFADSGEVSLRPGFNLIIGTNNSGKSSFLQGLSYPLKDKRHRPANWPRGQDLPLPSLQATVETSGEELLRFVGFSNRQMRYPFPPGYGFDSKGSIEEIRRKSRIQIQFRYEINGGTTAIRQPSHGEFTPDQGSWPALVITGQFGNVSYTGVENGQSDDLIDIVNSWWQRSVFLFKAERFAVSKCTSTNTTQLEQDASNLPAVLHTLFGDYKYQFDEIIGYVKSVFDTVGDITTRTDPNNNTQTEIVVTPRVSGKIRDRGFSLEECGTGVAQVLALLTGVSTIDSGVFIIDEINAFLHPAAAKSLIRILSTHYNQHQYVISSHSPEILSWHGFSSVHAVRRDGYESHLEVVDQKDMSKVRDIAIDLGISAADFFSAENVIWVEGPTEEVVFAFVAEVTRGSLPAATKFLSVVSTGDFNRKRDKQLVWDVYNRLSSANSPLLQTVRFSFDSEGLTETEKDDLIRSSKGLVTFIPRRNIEAYFIEPKSIAELLVQSDPECGNFTDDAVEEAIGIAASADESRSLWNGDLRNPAWLEVVDGANILKQVFAMLTNNRVSYDKISHGLALVKLIFEGAKEATLDDLPSHVLSLLPE